MANSDIATPKGAQPTLSLSDFRFQTAVVLRNADTDQFRHVNHAAMITYFEEGRIGIFNAPEIVSLLETQDLVVARINFSFHREVRYPGQVVVASSIDRVGSSSMTVRQALFQGGDCVASGEAICVVIDREARRPAAMDQRTRAFLFPQ
jgi:acyl-CoA thioester hydrolase